MKSLAILFSFLMVFSSGVTAQAETDNYLGRVFYNPELRFERGEDQNWAARSPLNLAVAIKKNQWTALLEVSRFSSDSTSGNSSIERTHLEALLWAQRELTVLSFSNQWRFSFYGAAGLGGFQEELKTQFLGDSSVDKSKINLLMGLSGGVETVIDFDAKSSDWALILGLELRGLSGQELDPNPQFSMLGRIGLQF